MSPAVTVSNGDGGSYARCRPCRWRGGVWEGPLRRIDAQDDADEHNRQKHVNESLTVGGEKVSHGTHR